MFFCFHSNSHHTFYINITGQKHRNLYFEEKNTSRCIILSRLMLVFIMAKSLQLINTVLLPLFYFPLLTFLSQYPVNVSIVNFTSWKGERLESCILGHRNIIETN